MMMMMFVYFTLFTFLSIKYNSSIETVTVGNYEHCLFNLAKISVDYVLGLLTIVH